MTAGDWVGMVACFLTLLGVLATALSAVGRRLDRLEARMDRAMDAKGDQ